MYTFTVNGSICRTEKDTPLMRYLRDELSLKSVKNGCAEGACGTCTVVIDGKAVKSCVRRTSRLEGANILTVEGLSERERAVFAYAFAEAGAVQCGFCIPGMVMCAKALIDAVPDPSPAEVKQAIRGNICRCTGYKKIELAILEAARLLRTGEPVKKRECAGLTGESAMRVDAVSKTLGEAVYADDVHMDGMLFGSAVRSAYPRAKILSIDVSAARALSGVAAVLTSEDVPGAKVIGHLKQDYDVMIPVGGVTRFLGDAVALIAAETPELLLEAKKLVKVEYEELPAVFSPKDALKDGAPLVHEGGNVLSREHLIRGDADGALSKSAHVVTERYSVPFTEHAFLEPECCVAWTEGDTVRLITGDQGVYQTRKECSAMLGLPPERVRVSAAMVGGGFGGKEDMSVQHHAALLAYTLRRPVKVALTREESILIHPKRHAMELTFTTGCDENGYLTAMKAELISDTGAYASLGGPVLQRACTHAAGPYNYQTIDITGTAVYTNNPPAGAFRGFGVTQSCFATEMNLNRLAEMCGISPFEIRYRNAIRPGQTLPNGQIADESTALAECLDAVRLYYEANPKAGIACAMKNSGLGVGIPDFGRAVIRIKDGRAHAHSSAACIGQGMGTVQMQLICETAGLRPSDVIWEQPDTLLSPDSGNTTASRQTVFTGEAVVRAASKLREALLHNTLAELEGAEFYGEYNFVTDKLGSDKANPVSHVAYGYAAELVELDDDGRVSRVVAAHDVGRVVNPKACEGQVEGGVAMCLGYALTEDFPLDSGRPTARFGTLGLLRATDVPEIKVILLGRDCGGPAMGAKGVGEIAAIPAAPAAALAYELRDGIRRTSLPLESTPYSKKRK